MASSQQMAVNEKEFVQQMIDKSKSIASSDQNDAVSNSLKKSQDHAKISMLNATKAPVKFNERKNWYGNIFGDTYPSSINPNNAASFTHFGTPQNGSSGGVVYHGTSNNGIPCAWLLAWAAPSEVTATAKNRVYVKCGSVSSFGTINWAPIRNQLATSGDYVTFEDKVTKTTISAAISTSGNIATLGANFGSY